MKLKNKIETKTIDPKLSLTLPLSDALHLEKSFKTSF